MTTTTHTPAQQRTHEEPTDTRTPGTAGGGPRLSTEKPAIRAGLMRGPMLPPPSPTATAPAVPRLLPLTAVAMTVAIGAILTQADVPCVVEGQQTVPAPAQTETP